MQHDNKLVNFYTGFSAFIIFTAFFHFSDLVLTTSTTGVKRKGHINERERRKLDNHMNQLFSPRLT